MVVSTQKDLTQLVKKNTSIFKTNMQEVPSVGKRPEHQFMTPRNERTKFSAYVRKRTNIISKMAALMEAVPVMPIRLILKQQNCRIIKQWDTNKTIDKYVCSWKEH